MGYKIVIDNVLMWISAGRGAAAALRFIGIHRLARRMLAARMGIVRISGFEFFPDRETMRRFRDLSEVLRHASEIKMILVGGSALVEGQTNVGNVKKVILPHPRSRSLSLYAESVGDISALPGKIESTTKSLLSKGVEVKWYPHMINHAVIITDPDLESGWVQWESVLPYGPLTSRPCVIVHKPKFERLTSSINRSFDEMFDNSIVPCATGDAMPDNGQLT